MPYISQEQRQEFDRWLDTIVEFSLTPGELNYVITKLLLKTKPKVYRDYNELIGVLECIKLELYRKAVVPYEDKKKEEHGEVYEQED
jgi:hypothetical protein